MRVVTDNGASYRAWAFTTTITSLASRHQRIRPYTPRHNGKVERYNRILAEECLYARAYSSEQQRRDAVAVWIHHYNHYRPHTACHNRPPATRIPSHVTKVMTSCTWSRSTALSSGARRSRRRYRRARRRRGQRGNRRRCAAPPAPRTDGETHSRGARSVVLHGVARALLLGSGNAYALVGGFVVCECQELSGEQTSFMADEVEVSYLHACSWAPVDDASTRCHKLAVRGFLHCFGNVSA